MASLSESQSEKSADGDERATMTTPAILPSSSGDGGADDSTSVQSQDPHDNLVPPSEQENFSPISPEHLTVVGGLGHGDSSVVVEIESSLDQRRLAMKCISKSSITETKRQRRVINEIEVLRRVQSSRFLVESVFTFETNSGVFIVTDLLSGGDLFFHLDKQLDRGCQGFSEDQTRILLAEISLGLVHLHNRGFVHRDVKIENIMLDGRGHVKLIDFGLAIQIPLDATPQFEVVVSTGGSLLCMSPELLRRRICGRFTDWWAVGIVAYELLTGRSPWSSLTDTRQIRAEIKGFEVRAPEGLSSAAGEFVVGLLQRNRRLRLGTRGDDDVLTAPFFSHVNMEAIERGEIPPALVVQQHEGTLSTPDDSEFALARYREMLATPAESDGPSVLNIGAGLLQAALAPNLE